ncbi:hypothetical protein BH09BAC5_BH09BAC5_26100 [soil metagenome]
MKLLILYSEVAAYTLACLAEFTAQYPEVEVFLVHWKVNKEAPFNLSFAKNIKVYNRSDFENEGLLALSDKLKPDAILCSGWIDKGYLAVCKSVQKKIPVILCMDNRWSGTLKQHLAKLVSPFKLQRIFNYAWVPGIEQKYYALKLGFSEKNVKTGFYSADTLNFSKHYNSIATQKKIKYPHRFVYVGRYYEFKGVNELWDAFRKFKEETENDWELWCVGTGDVLPANHIFIKHFGFIQPENLPEIIDNTGVFILPSRKEPWGVVVHEFAAAGFPLLLSEKVGASQMFLKEKMNGFSFKANNVESIINAMKSIVALSDRQLYEMGQLSNKMAESISTKTWAHTLFDLINHPTSRNYIQ